MLQMLHPTYDLEGPVSLLVGICCGTVGVAIYLNSRGICGSLIGMGLVILGILTPNFPWWILLSQL